MALALAGGARAEHQSQSPPWTCLLLAAPCVGGGPGLTASIAQAWVSPWQVAHVLSIIATVKENMPQVDEVLPEAQQRQVQPCRTLQI